ncbi:MAG: hypothetical protein HRT52_03230 [Colwellia sp.]|nr:hypothetical protein [Colwellia sp.]
MNLAISELKIQAKIMLKAIKAGGSLLTKQQRQLRTLNLESTQEIKLKHCHFLIAKKYGFDSWQHAQQILSGDELSNSMMNMGTLFHSSRCDALINLWFANYKEAQEALAIDEQNRWLIPYKQQYIVVNKEYLKMIGLDRGFDQHWLNIQHNLVKGYGSDSWDILAVAALKN